MVRKVVCPQEIVDKPELACHGEPGTVFLPFHWGGSFHEETSANYVTNDAVDPVSLQPELKFAAVRLEPAPTPKLQGVTS